MCISCGSETIVVFLLFCGIRIIFCLFKKISALHNLVTSAPANCHVLSAFCQKYVLGQFDSNSITFIESYKI